MEINKVTLRSFREEFKSAMADLEKKHGVSINMGTISYDANEFRTKVTVNNVGDVDNAGGNVEKATFQLNAHRYGFKASDYNKEVQIYGSTYYLVGFKLNARKNVCIIKNAKGTTYVIDAKTVRDN